MKHGKFIMKIFCFTLILGFVLKVTDTVLIPKYLYNNDWPTTQTITDFYDLEEDSIDVLFLGSSACVSSFTPLELYENYNITSYNLGTEQQNLLVSYYWLKEALRYQSPKVVVLDTRFLFPYKENEPLNSDESAIRKAIDYMKWSSVKRKAIYDICKIDKNQNQLSYYFPNVRFHTRWTSLNEDDFIYGIFDSHKALMGFTILNNLMGKESEPFESGTNKEIAQPNSIMQEYLDKIVQLCKEEDILLMLVKTPDITEELTKYNYLNVYATNNEICFIDFNEKSVYDVLGYNYANDNYDDNHLNLRGATKVTNYIGKILIEEYDILPQKSEEHENLLDYYSAVKKDYSLIYVTDIYEYLDLIKDNRYTIFISIKDEGTIALDNLLKQKLSILGTTVNFDNKFRYSYYAVINGDEPNEEISDKELKSEGTLRNGRVTYSISSAGCLVGNFSSVKIGASEYSKNKRGMNFVIYCLDTKKVIDSVAFDTYEGLVATR